MKIITLGPKGTFSEQAVLIYQKDAELVFSKNISGIFESVKSGQVDMGVVPVENMIDGSVGETLDLLYNNDLFIVGELIIPIELCIASLGEFSEIKTVLSHPKALGQVRGYIREHNFDTRNTVSTADAMKNVVESNDKSLGAIGPEIAAKEYGLKIFESGIEDRKNNVTRFFVISKNKKEKEECKEYKTSLVIKPDVDKPGLLHDLLESFASRSINLTKIESRPTKVSIGDYIFYIDLEGHEEDENVKEALDEIKKENTLKIFGSYEKKY